MSKVCSKCKIEKSESEFYSNKRMPDGLDYYCKECRKIQSNPPECKELIVRQKNDLRKDNAEFVESLKTECIKCGEDRPWIIQFHHVDHNNKEFNISQYSTRSRRAIWNEVSKCVCLCSNCHDEFHYFFGTNPDNPVEALDKYLNEDY